MGAPAGSVGPLTTQLVSGAAISLLVVVGISGFSAAYGGTRYLLAGTIGVALGATVALVGARRRWSAPTVGLVSVLAFFLFGSAVTLSAPEVGGLVPTPANLADLIDGATQGWARLITAQPPVGARLNLLVVPYLCGLTSAVVGVSVAIRSRRPLWAALAPLLVLVVGILFGTSAAPPLAALVAQGGVFAGVLIGWWAFVYRSRRRVDVGVRDTRRTLSLLVVLVVACVLATALGQLGLVPGMHARPRFVLRDLTEPPFDPAEYPSPLNSYRRYTNGALFPEGEPANEGRIERAGWRSEDLFEVRGLPEDRRLRLATLDSYDGTVFGVAAGSGSSGHFERVGEELPVSSGPGADAPAGRAVDDATVTIEVLPGAERSPYEDIWLPLPEGAERLRIENDDAARQLELGENLQYNAVTGTAAVPQRLGPGDRIVVDASIPAFGVSDEVRSAWLQAAAGGDGVERLRLEATSGAARQLLDGTFCTPADAATPEAAAASPVPADDTVRTPFAVASQIGAQLIACGAFSDGDSQSPSQPGHSAWRLNGMLAETDGEAARMIGNGEQYAPLAALLADTVGAPTRVVMGFRSLAESNAWREGGEGDAKRTIPPHADGVYTVTGSDVTTWIEVDLEGIGWVPVYDIIPTQTQPQQRPTPQAPLPQNEPPPPPPSIPPSEESEADAERFQQDSEKEDEEGFSLPPWVLKAVGAVLAPVLVLAAITGAIGWLKSRRRTRRRTSGTADARIAGGWAEVKDLAADLGRPVPARSTRREEAGFIGVDEVHRLAGRADAMVFGGAAPADLPVDDYWNQVEAARSSMLSGLSRFGRWKVLVNLASLRRSRSRPTRPRRDLAAVAPAATLEGT